MLRTLAAVLVFATGAALIALADAPFVRYASVGNSHVCAVQQMASLPQNLDVVILGSSRVRRGVGPNIIADVSGGRFTNVYNLARPGRDIVRNAIMFDELLDTGHTVDLLILEMDLDIIRHGRLPRWNWRPVSAGFAPWKYILLHSPHTTGAHIADPRIVLDGLRLKLQQALKLSTTGIIASVLANPAAGPTTVCWQDDFDIDRPNLVRGRARALAEVQTRFPNPDTQFDNARVALPLGPRARVELQMYAHIRKRAAREGVQLIVVRPQGYGEPALGPRAITDVQQLVPDFRFPPDEMTRRLNRSHIDRNHYGPEGRELFTRWITETALAERENAASVPATRPQPPRPAS